MSGLCRRLLQRQGIPSMFSADQLCDGTVKIAGLDVTSSLCQQLRGWCQGPLSPAAESVDADNLSGLCRRLLQRQGIPLMFSADQLWD